MKSHADYALIFKALSDETRLKIIELLTEEELCACNLLDQFQITQPTLSYHMKILTACNLVLSRKEGSWMRYKLNTQRMQEISEFWQSLTQKDKPKVAFICVHNSCRSQIAEALGKKYAFDVFSSYSAGTELKDHINPDAVRLMKHLYQIDMEQTQKNKLLEAIPTPDIVITMGCNVSCPSLPCKYREDWGLDDPSGKSDEEFLKTIQTIDTKIHDLKSRILNGLLI